MRASGGPGGRERLLVRALAGACEAGDAAAFASLLDPDVSVVVDGGGVSGVTTGAVKGIGDGTLLLLQVLAAHPDTTVAEHAVNGGPGLVVTRGARVVAVISLGAGRGRVREVWAVLNPQKLERWNRA